MVKVKHLEIFKIFACLYTEQNLHFEKHLIRLKLGLSSKHPIPCKSFDKKFDKNFKISWRLQRNE